MTPDDHVCLCFRVSLRKLTHFLEREEPRVPSQLSECLNAGTGCGWCVPQLERLHEQWREGEEIGIAGNPGERLRERARWQADQRADRERQQLQSQEADGAGAGPRDEG